nr:integrase, catalytic region, zinc finger, CCHC-type, peptidase aspartic, catalytic [Tanacetum cinerariifolium]
DNSPRINRNAGYENQRNGTVVGARETVGSTVVQKSGIQCYKCKEFGHVARECQKPKRAKDATFHREKMLLCKQEEAGIQLNAEQADWRDDTDDDELEDQELEAHYIYMAQIQKVSSDAADSGPIFDDEPLQKVSNDDHNNVFSMENIIEEIDQNDDDNDLSRERELLASLIEKLKCEIDESKNRNKFLETSNKALIENLKGEIEDFKNKNKSLESSNNFFKEANNRLSETDNLLYADYKKSEAELARRNSKEYVSRIELECAKVRGFYNDNLALMLTPDSDEVIRLEKESRSKLSDLIRPFDYEKLNNLEYYYADHMNAILGVYTELDEVTNLQCDYLELLEKCEGLETSKSKMMSKSFESVQKHAINLELELQQYKEKIKNDMFFKVNKTKDFCKEREQYFEIQDLKAQLQDKCIVIRVILTTSVSRPSLKSNQQGDRVMHNNSQGKKPKVEDHRRSVKLSKNKAFVTACNDSLNAKTLNVKSLVEIVLFIVDSGCSKHMTGNLKLLINFVEKFLGTVKFGNDQIAPILGYGYLVQGAVTIKRVYYVEGLNHNLFFIGQFCNADLEVAFRKSACFIRDLKGNDLLTGSCGTDLYSITLQDTNSPNLICLMAKATSSQAWLWHRRLLNAKTMNVKSHSAMCAKCVMIEKHDLCVPKSVAKPLRKIVASESIKKPRNNVRKLHERFGKIYKWSYIKFTPSGYIWKPKSKQANVNPNISKPLRNTSRTVNVKDTMTTRRSIVSNTPLSSNSFAAHRDCPIHRRL